MFNRLRELLFPPKCVLCGKVLDKSETDLCENCRKNTPDFRKSKFKVSFVADWTALWYYRDNPRNSLLRFKFCKRPSYATAYGRFLAIKLQAQRKDDFDVLTWVTTGKRRQRQRGYDQAQLIAVAVAKELGIDPVKTLEKIRHTPPQSTFRDAAQRRANVLGAYVVTDPTLIAGKRILLLDDIITTGATASECAKTLLYAGAKSVSFAAVAAASDNNTK